MSLEIISRARQVVEKIGVLKNFNSGKTIDNQKLIDQIVAHDKTLRTPLSRINQSIDWKMHQYSDEFKNLSKTIIKDGVIPYLRQYYKNDEETVTRIEKRKYITCAMWSTGYRGNNQDNITSHSHPGYYVSYCYYLQTPTGSPPLVFDELQITVDPEPGMLVLFRGDYFHHVPASTHKESRIAICGNIVAVQPQVTFS
jgi:hypothetical protein